MGEGDSAVTFSPVVMLCLLVAGHAVADYPLQGDFLSAAKNHKKTPYPDVHWVGPSGCTPLSMGPLSD